MRRSGLAIVAASLLLGFCGCALPVGIAYPTLSYTPSVGTDEDSAKDLHAFRVNFVEKKLAAKQDDAIKCDFAEINLTSKGEVPGQKVTGVSYHWAMYFLPGSTEPLNGKVHTFDKWVRVRLYRRGFKTIEIGPDTSRTEPIDWVIAENDNEREDAVDDLVGVKRNSYKHLLPGSTSESQKTFLLFAQAEYEHLASRIKEDSLVNREARWRLTHKAERFRDLAAQ
jgi:hypothetical protein